MHVQHHPEVSTQKRDDKRLVQGGHDPNVPIAAAKTVASEWPKQVEIVGVTDSGDY